MQQSGQRVSWADVAQESQPSQQPQTQRATGQRVNWADVAEPEPQPRFSNAWARNAREGIRRGVDAFTGADAPFDGRGEVLTNVPRDTSAGDQVRLAAGYVLTPDDERRAEIIREQFPNAEFITDRELAQREGVEWPEGRNPRLMTRLEPDREYLFLNAPGFSPTDVSDMGSAMALFAPAARVQGAGRTALGRMFMGAGAAGGTQYASEEAAQLVGAEEGANLGRVGLTSIFAAGGELAATGMGRVRARSSSPTVLDAGGADALNVTPGMTPVSPVANSASQSTADQARQSLADEFGVRLTRGQAARQPDAMRTELQLTRGAQGPAARDTIRPFFEGQVEQLDEAGRRFSGADRQTIGQAGDRVRDTLSGGANDLMGQVDDAYGIARSLDARFDPESFRALPQAINQHLRNQGRLIDAELTPQATAARSEIARLVNTSRGENVSAVSIREIDRTRRRINARIEAAQTNEDKASVRAVRDALDSWTDRAIDDALIRGDEGAIEALREARALRARYGRIYSQRPRRRRGGSMQPDPAGRMIEQIVEDNLTGEQVVNLMFGRSQIGNKAGTARAVERIVEGLGPDSAEVQALREAYITRLMDRLPGSDRSVGNYAGFANAWADAVRGSGREITSALFSREERAAMARFARLAEELVAPDGAARTSGSPEGLAALARGFDGLASMTGSAGRLALQGRTLLWDNNAVDPALSAARQAIRPERIPPDQPLLRSIGPAFASSSAMDTWSEYQGQ